LYPLQHQIEQAVQVQSSERPEERAWNAVVAWVALEAQQSSIESRSDFVVKFETLSVAAAMLEEGKH